MADMKKSKSKPSRMGGPKDPVKNKAGTGLLEKARRGITGRQRRLDEAERKAMGYAKGGLVKSTGKRGK